MEGDPLQPPEDDGRKFTQAEAERYFRGRATRDKPGQTLRSSPALVPQSASCVRGSGRTRALRVPTKGQHRIGRLNDLSVR